MLVARNLRYAPGLRLQDMRGGRAPLRDTPSIVDTIERCLLLRPGQAELSAVVLETTCADVVLEDGNALLDFAFRQPLHVLPLRQVSLRGNYLHRPRAILAGGSKQRERVVRRNLVPRSPSLQGALVVGQKTPHEIGDDARAMALLL